MRAIEPLALWLTLVEFSRVTGSKSSTGEAPGSIALKNRASIGLWADALFGMVGYFPDFACLSVTSMSTDCADRLVHIQQ